MDVCIALFFLAKPSFRRRVVVELLSLQMETKLEERNVESIRRDEKNAPRVVIAVVVVVVVVIIFVSAFVSRASFVRCAIARLMLSMYLLGKMKRILFYFERREREKKKKKSNDMRYNFFLHRARARGGALKLSLCLSLSPDLLVMMM
jgi:FlaA1/EpsC-like NDP-sugar epimerase